MYYGELENRELLAKYPHVLYAKPSNKVYILTEPEVNNCFSIFTRSDLNRIRKETIKRRLV